jgi:hypothetical protein
LPRPRPASARRSLAACGTGRGGAAIGNRCVAVRSGDLFGTARSPDRAAVGLKPVLVGIRLTCLSAGVDSCSSTFFRIAVGRAAALSGARARLMPQALAEHRTASTLADRTTVRLYLLPPTAARFVPHLSRQEDAATDSVRVGLGRSRIGRVRSTTVGLARVD